MNHPAKTFFHIVFLLLALFVVASIYFYYSSQSMPLFAEPPAAKENNPVSLKSETSAVNTASQKSDPSDSKKISEAIRRCRADADPGKCLDIFFREFLKTKTTAAALYEIDALSQKDESVRLGCHEVVHAIGRETFLKEKTVHDSFAACNQTCHSGCYHGAMERFLRGDDDTPAEERAHISRREIEQKVKGACASNDPINLRFQCLHGLGHAVMFYFDYDLKGALSLCSRLDSSWDQSSCYGGVFMENVHSATPEKRYLSKTDFHFPCNAIDEKYRSDCYVMQTTRMAEMGLAKAQIIAECGKAGTYRLNCLQSLGRDSSNDVRLGKGRVIAELCESVSDVDGKYACMRGAVFALADNTWDGRYVFPFCRDFVSSIDRQNCFQTGVNYLKSMLLVAEEKLRKDCVNFASRDLYCLELTGGQ